jgi:hypothetical protein
MRPLLPYRLYFISSLITGRPDHNRLTMDKMDLDPPTKANYKKRALVLCDGDEFGSQMQSIYYCVALGM